MEEKTMTDKQKQIEEIAKHCCFPCDMECNGECLEGTDPCKCYISLEVAKTLYKAGYRKQSGWISVDERLPEMHEDVLCLCGRSVEIDFRCSDDTWCGVHNNPITHWMPLPEPPKMKGCDD
jgi:hypothetical protein